MNMDRRKRLIIWLARLGVFQRMPLGGKLRFLKLLCWFQRSALMLLVVGCSSARHAERVHVEDVQGVSVSVDSMGGGVVANARYVTDSRLNGRLWLYEVEYSAPDSAGNQHILKERFGGAEAVAKRNAEATLKDSSNIEYRGGAITKIDNKTTEMSREESKKTAVRLTWLDGVKGLAVSALLIWLIRQIRRIDRKQ